MNLYFENIKIINYLFFEYKNIRGICNFEGLSE